MNKILFFILIMILAIPSVLATEKPLLALNQYKGKVVYLDFWASWCIPCRKSFPWLNKIQNHYLTDELVVIAVNLDKEKFLATEFLAKYPASFKVVYDPKGTLAKKYRIKGMPSSILFGKDGKPKFVHKGFFLSKVSSYEKEIAQLIAEK